MIVLTLSCGWQCLPVLNFLVHMAQGGKTPYCLALRKNSDSWGSERAKTSLPKGCWNTHLFKFSFIININLLASLSLCCAVHPQIACLPVIHCSVVNANFHWLQSQVHTFVSSEKVVKCTGFKMVLALLP